MGARPQAGTDHEWEEWGRRDPYFAVLTDERFRASKLTQEARAEFFASGHWQVEHLMAQCRQRLDPAFSPARVLDFGCGVGRLLLPFARSAVTVVGVDVSQAMLDEATANCRLYGISNVELVRSDDGLTQVSGTFDLVHSAIVLQHIEVERGRELFRQLVARIAPGGIGAIHVTYAKAWHADRFGQPPPAAAAAATGPASVAPDGSRRRGRIAGTLKTLLRRAARRPLETTPATAIAERHESAAPDTDPEMQMNSYSLNDLAFLMQSAGVADFHAAFSDHGGELGVVLLFRKPAIA